MALTTHHHLCLAHPHFSDLPRKSKGFEVRQSGVDSMATY